MSRLIFFILLAFLALLIWRKLMSAGQSKGESSAAAPEQLTENVVPCAHCGLHIPLSESVPDGEEHYCCPEHRRQARGE